MRDSILVPLRASEHSDDFRKPVTVTALQRFDPDLRLVRNRRNAAFEVHRVVPRVRRYWIEGLGSLAYLEHMLIYVTDWTEGLEARDDPTALIAWLEAGDIRRHPELNDDAHIEYEIRRQREAMAARNKDNWRHAFRDSRRQLYRAWEPLQRPSALVR